MKDAKGHGSNGRGRHVPLPGHAYHGKTDAELRYIIKDAGEAARASRGLTSYNPNSGKREDTEGKYLDQVNDASTVLGYRSRISDSEAASALGQGHAKSEQVPAGWQHDAPQYHAHVTAKNGRVLAKYGPHHDRDAVIKQAFEGSPKAKQVTSMRGMGMDIRWHKR